MNTEFLTDTIVLLAAAVIVVPLFQSFGLGAIPGFLVAGIVLGPSGLGFIENYDEIGHLAELGVVLLLFVIGIEMNPSRLWKMKRLVLGLGSLQVFITGGIITIMAHAVLSSSWGISLLIGSALALSSTAFVLQLLTEKKMLSSEYGRPAVAVLLLQDLLVVPLLAFVSLMATPELTVAEDMLFAFAEALLILVLILTTTRYILNPTLNRLARFSSPEIFTASALLLVLGSAYVMERIGLSLAMGAFTAGLLIADSSYRHQIIAEIQPFRGLLLGLFFMSMGMSLNLTLFFANPLVLLGIVVALIAGKFIILWPLSRIFGISNRTSISIALLLAQSGEFALVLFALAKGVGLFEDTLFQYLLVIVLLSMLVTPALEKAAYQIFSSIREGSTTIPEFEIDRKEQDAKPVLLVGFGRMGRKIGFVLDFMKMPYVAIDSNAALVDRERAEGKPVYFGDVKRAEVFRAAGVADASVVIVAIDDFEVTERVVSTLHAAYPAIPIFVRGHDMVRCQALKALGAQFTVSETLEASAELAREALLHMGVEAPDVEVALDDLRKDYYERTNQVRVETKPGPNIP